MDAKRPFSGFFEVPHTADIAIEVSANTLADLFINAANGLYHILGIQKGTGNRKKLHLKMEEMDIESLLVSFLNELLFYVETKKAAVSCEIEIEECRLHGIFEMEEIVSWRREIKAVTYNELKIRKVDQGYETKIVFDI